MTLIFQEHSLQCPIDFERLIEGMMHGEELKQKILPRA